MAGLCDLRILLLCTGIITLAESYRSTVIDPKTPTPVKCSYSVSTIRFGLQINLTDSPSGNYSVTLTEKGTQIEKNVPIQQSNQILHPITGLKPCTEYEHAVSFIDSTGKQTSCDYSGNKTTGKTFGIKKDDVTESSCVSGQVCYRSDWDMSSSISASNNVPAEQCNKDPKEFCIKPRINDICTTLTTTFTSGKCLEVRPFSLTEAIPFDFLDVSEIQKEFLTGFPVKVEPDLPTKCENLTVDYTCLENGKTKEPKNVSTLEPFTNYYCKGVIKQNNGIKTHTFGFKVNVICDLTTRIINPKSTNTSINLSWTTTSQNCTDVPTKDPKFKHDCSCDPKPKHGSDPGYSGGRTCEIRGLDPYTDYTCRVQPVYDGRPVGRPDPVLIKTDVGIPEVITSLSVTVKDHNMIIVTCTPPNNFNGPQKKYFASLRLDGVVVKKEKNRNDCNFVFEDLSYSTKYILEVAAHNGKLEGIVKIKEVNTLYNDRAVIGVLIIFIFLLGLVVPAMVYKHYAGRRRRSENRVYEEVRLEETAINVNMPRPH